MNPTIRPGGVQSQVSEGVLTATITRPDALNAVTAETLTSLSAAVEDAAADPSVAAIVLRGEGRAFCSGADLGTADDLAGEGSAATIDGANRLVAALRDTPLPVVAVVHGPCAGVGVPIALAADLVLASDTAFFMLAFTKIGLMPDGGSTALVAASIGRARAMHMALLAERIGAEDALAMGLVSAVHPADELETAVDAVVDRLRHGPRVAFAETKQAINAATLGSLDGAFRRERDGQVRLLGSADFAEGAAAFSTKRAPQFTDR